MDRIRVGAELLTRELLTVEHVARHTLLRLPMLIDTGPFRTQLDATGTYLLSQFAGPLWVDIEKVRDEDHILQQKAKVRMVTGNV
jgi:hypothetical protein